MTTKICSNRLPVEALMGKPCGIVAMGATAHHYLGDRMAFAGDCLTSVRCAGAADRGLFVVG